MRPSRPLARRQVLVLLGPLLLFATSTSALANAGTPLMWAGMLHLVFGNFLIGIGEGLVLAWVFKLRKIACVALMIAANYASAWIGLYWLDQRVVRSIHLELYNAWHWVWIMAGISYLVTLVIEWPFVVWCFLKEPRWIRRSVLGCLLVQTISYLVLFWWYWGASGKSLYTKGNIVALSDFDLPPGVSMYSIGRDDGDVHEFDFDTRATRQFAQLGSTNWEDRLAVWPANANAGPYAVVARIETADVKSPTIREILGGLTAGQVAVEAGRGGELQPASFNFGAVPRLGGATNTGWDVWTGFWPVEGLFARDSSGKLQLHIAFETPFAAWSIRNATQLASNHIVFQLGEDQVCILEPSSRKVARLVFGRGPVVVLKKARS
jgi:hypothetical protein